MDRKTEAEKKSIKDKASKGDSYERPILTKYKYSRNKLYGAPQGAVALIDPGDEPPPEE